MKQSHEEALATLRVYYHKNRKRLMLADKIRNQRHEYKTMKKHDRTLKARFTLSKWEAAKRNLTFELTIDEYNKLISQPCYYCKSITFQKECGIGLDRIDNSKDKGYTLDNVLPCCGTCNMSKSDKLTVDEMKLIIYYRKLKRFLGGI